MKPKSIKSLLALALLAPGVLFAQTTAKTTPVGYVSLGDTTSGEPACKPETDVFISVPVLKSADYTGTVASETSGVITLAGSPAFTTGQYSDAAAPYYAVIQTGAKAGLIGLVTANDAGTITVSPQPGDSLSGLVAGDVVTLRRAWTVAGLLGNSLPVGVSLLTFPASGAVNPSAEGIYDWDGTNWVDNVITGAPADNDVIYPGETVVLRNSTTTPIASLVVSGEVSTFAQRIPIAAAEEASDYSVSYFSPVGEALGNSGLGAVAVAGDALLGFDNNSSGVNKSASVILDHDGSDWIDNVITGAPDNSFEVGAGKGFFFRRGAAGPSAVWSDTAAYVPSL